MRTRDLSVSILQNVRHRALQDTNAPAAARRVGAKSGGVFSDRLAATARLNSQEAHVFVGDERMKQTDRVRATADAGEQGMRQFSRLKKNLLARFSSDHALKFADH